MWWRWPSTAFLYAVATLGTATTAEHIERLFRVASDLVFCFDGDRAGRTAAWRALELRCRSCTMADRSVSCSCPKAKIPILWFAGKGRAVFERRLEKATALAEHLFAELRAQVAPDTLAGRARLAELARPLLGKTARWNFSRAYGSALAAGSQVGDNPVTPAACRLQATAADHGLRLTRTPLRKAIALLLYKPELAQQPLAADDPALQDDNELGTKLLAELLALLRANPQLSAATLLERYRDRREGAILERLAAWEPEVPEQDYQFRTRI
ncbi:MAG: toprim domain-containing protein [Candidatus Competibacteraceae bacterium]|nr:toprim domain-containing protein [Candidatus Competibacteraceae bacterium]